jgi:hypothetical protein
MAEGGPEIWGVVQLILSQIESLESGSPLHAPARELTALLDMHERLLPCEAALGASLAMHSRERDVYADKMQRIARRLAAEGAAAADDEAHAQLSRVVLLTRDQLESSRAIAEERQADVDQPLSREERQAAPVAK